MAGAAGSNPVVSFSLDGRRCDLYVAMEMALTLRTFHDAKPAMTGRSWLVAAEAYGVGSLIAANDQQPRGY
jgi:hypothetical protein